MSDQVDFDAPKPVNIISAFSSAEELVPEQPAPAVVEEPKPAEEAKPAEEPKPAEEAKQAEEEKKPVVIKDKFSLLSKRERELQRQIEEVKSVKASEDWKKFLEFNAVKDEKDIGKKVAKLGLTIDEVANYYLNKPTGMTKVEEELTRKISKLEADISSKEERAKEELIANQTRDYLEEVRKISSSSDDYEMIVTKDAYDLVWDAVEALYQETGKIYSPKEACDIVEQVLVEEEEARLEALAKTKKFAKLKAGKVDEAPKKQESPSARVTLGNGSVNKGSVVKEDRFMSDEERYKEALKLLQFK